MIGAALFTGLAGPMACAADTIGAGGVGGGRGGGEGTASQISQWVEDSFTPSTVDGVTIYDSTAER